MSTLTVQTTINAPIAKVREAWNQPEHIIKRAFASDDRHAPVAENDLQVGGKFKTTMAAKDGSASFDFVGIYTHIEPMKLIEYTIGAIQLDSNHTVEMGRKVRVSFEDTTDNTSTITETFDTEDMHTMEQQQQWRQSILDNFKKYVESITVNS